MSEIDATPAAEEKAIEAQVDLNEVDGTGKDGRVTAPDVDAYLDERDDEPSGEVEVEVEAPSLEDQAEDADQALKAHDIDPNELYAKEAALPPNAQPSGGTLPRVEEQVGSPLTEDQLRQIAEQSAAFEYNAERAGWKGEKQPDPLAPSDEEQEQPEPEPQIEPNPVEALQARAKERRDAGEPPAPGSAEERQLHGASDASVRTPLLQRPAEEQGGHATHQNTVYQEGETRPGERSLENDAPAYQTAVNHVPGTPLPDEYYETAGPAPQPTLHQKRTQEELEEDDA